MEPSIRDPRSFFDAHVPFGVQERLLRSIHEAYENASTLVQNTDLPSQSAHDLFPYVLRATVDFHLMSALPKLGEAAAIYDLNIAENCFHASLKLGNRVILTASAVEKPNTVVRSAMFRNTLAVNQYRFVIDENRNTLVLEQADIPEDAKLYAILIHGPEGFGLGSVMNRSRYRPGFVHIVFPNTSCTAYLDNIDLMGRFRAAPVTIPKAIPVQDEAIPKLNVVPIPKPN